MERAELYMRAVPGCVLLLMAVPGRAVDSVQNPDTRMAFELLRSAWTRNPLTGYQRFMDEIEQRAGLRIEYRSRG